jgi:hypothetical protein
MTLSCARGGWTQVCPRQLPAAVACNLTAVAVTLGEITDQNREAVLALRVAPGQERFVSSVEDSLAAAADYPQAKPWYRAVFASARAFHGQGLALVFQEARQRDALVSQLRRLASVVNVHRDIMTGQGSC